jgi:Xaa-Pro dipeptidase
MIEQRVSTPLPEIDRRIADLQRELLQNGIDGALILQTTDRFYFSGTIQQGLLYVPCQGAALLMVRKSLERAQRESPLKHIIALDSPKQLVTLLREHGLEAPAVVGMELDVLPAATYLTYREMLSGADIVDIATPIRMIRAIKSPYEVELIRQASRFADQVAERVPDLVRSGMTEIELAGKVEAEARRLGHQGIIRMRLWGSEMFYGHLMAGPAAAEPSFLASPTGGRAVNAAVAQGPSFRRIRPQEPILVDYIFAWQGYLSDHTRIFVLGDPPDDLVRAHQIMLDLQNHIRAAARPGVPAGDLYQRAIDIAARKGVGDHFMGTGDHRIRFIGHGIGLEVDEFPFLAQGQTMPLAEGMTIALEPKLILPDVGVVGIENTHVVTANGLEALTLAPEAIRSLPVR